MSKHSDLYNQVREEIARWPQWKINAYNEMIATSAHAEKVTPHTPTNADRIRAMTDEEMAEFIIWKAQTFGNSDYCILECDNGDCKECALDWLQQPAKEE